MLFGLFGLSGFGFGGFFLGDEGIEAGDCCWYAKSNKASPVPGYAA